SLTKVMTSVVFLENNPGMDSEVMISSYDSAVGAHIGLASGDIVKNRDLFFTTLVGSKNNAAKALARSTGMSTTDFVNRMNDKARELELPNTSFVGVTGLNSGNQSSAIDYAKLSIYAYKNLEMLQASTAKSYGFSTINSGKYLSCANTNKLLHSSLYITGGKTGYLPYDWGGINYNLMVKARDDDGNEVVGVIMGNNSPSDIRADMESLIRWGFDNYSWE
ncbi:MAG: D-alanyl-D-alanine carboxypeptidase, partial [Parcubacteria group bacterium]|nr:D-alanyl-D-alanine carboxypeptidase [Parcubacteria group bacterium]